ncbi:MAG: MATE family efflux transporter [Clostridia bacterium]|nr:MATE family efflux transporter [Clostridia bacterium]
MEKKFRKQLSLLPIVFSLAWPTMLEQIMQTAVQYVDTAMVGSLGTTATAAVGATVTVNWLVNSTISALGVGFLAYIAQADGAGERKKISAASSQALLAVLVCGLFFTVLTLSLSRYVPVFMQVEPSIRDITAKYFFILYTPMLFRTATIIFGTLLRAVGDTKTPMIVGLGVNIINVVLNFALIYPTRTVSLFSKNIRVYGAGMGVIGAALASAIAFIAGGILITVALFKHPLLTPKCNSIRPNWNILKPCLSVALPNALQRFGTSLGYVVFAAMVNSLGEISTAAHTIANTVESAFYIPGFGMQTAAATLAGNAYGAKDKKRIWELGKTIIFIETVLMLLSGSLLFIFAENMVGLFSKDAQVILLGTTILKMVALSEPFYGISIVIEGMMQGMGKTLTSFIFNITGMWGIRIVGTFICIYLLGYGLISAWSAMILHNMLLFVLFTIHYVRGKWIQSNIQVQI